MREVVTLVNGVTVSPDVPGYLELSREKLDRLVIREPIEKFYDVEEEPFARGKSAAVRRCVERSSGRHYAAKFLKKRRRSAEIRSETLHEVAVLEACRGCHRVVSLHQVYESPAETVLILELACGGELQTLLDSDEVPSEGQVVRLMRQILDGIVYLHSINVAHLDLKPQNLVLTGEYPSCDVKLCDFGISRYLSQGADVREILGTPDYVAPEVLNYEPISLATDMWSVGVLMYVLLTGCSPFGGDTKQETFCNITQCRLDFPDELFEDISQEAQDLMTKLMVMKPSDRLCANECLQHTWFMKDFSSVPSTPKSMTPLQRTPVPMRRETNIRQPELSATTETLLPIPSSEENDNLSTNTIFIERKTSFRESSSEKLDNKKVHLDNETLLDNETCLDNELKLDNKAEQEKQVTNETSKPPEVKVTRVESFRSMVRANGMQTMPVSKVTRFHHMQNINREPNRETLFKFKQIYITDDMDESPPASISGSSSGSSISTDTTFSSDSNSDTVSDMSIDSSSDRSSIISLDDSLDFTSGKGLSHYRYFSSSCFNVWEVSRPQKPWSKTIRECSGTYARARSIFSKLSEDGREGQFLRDSKLAVFNSNNLKLSPPPPPSVANKCIALELKKEQNSNIVTIKEVKPVRGKRYTRTSEVKCETVKSRIRKLEVYSEKSGEFVKEFKYDVF